MMLRIQHERMHGHVHPVGARVLHALRPDRRARCARADRDVIVMHPGPMNRGVEIDSEVADGPYSVILEQVTQRRRRADGGALPALRRDATGAESHEAEAADARAAGSSIPADGRDGAFDVLIEDGAHRASIGKICRPTAPRCSRSARPGRRARADRHPRPPARARAGAQGDRRAPARRRRSPAASPPSPACRTPSRSTTRRHHRVHPEEGGRGRPRARLSDRRGVDRARRASSWPRSASRRPPAASPFTDDGRPVANALLMRRALEYAGDARHAGHRSLRGSVAQGRRRRARGLLRRRASACAASPAPPNRHGGARHLARRADRRRTSTSPT